MTNYVKLDFLFKYKPLAAEYLGGFLLDVTLSPRSVTHLKELKYSG